MNRIPLEATERELLGKKVKNLRKEGILPAHVFGNKLETEHVSVKLLEFLKVYDQAGETGLIDLKIGAEKIRPVMIKGVQLDAVSGDVLHADFYQVNLSEKVTVPVPIDLIGEEPELVHTGEAVVIQHLSEIEVEALPTDLIENIEVDKSVLKAIGDSILVSDLKVPATITILTDPESVVVKLDDAVTDEMKKLMEEQAAEQAAVTAEAQAPEGEEAGTEGESEGAGGEGEEKQAEEKTEEKAE